MLLEPNNTRETKGAVFVGVFVADRGRLFDGQHHGELPVVTCSKLLAWSIGRSG
jgi:hypothetical protein